MLTNRSFHTKRAALEIMNTCIRCDDAVVLTLARPVLIGLMPLSHDRIFASVRRRIGTRQMSYLHVLFKLRTRPERSS